jgi:transitional endoplasmic reticulum ATPase
MNTVTLVRTNSSVVHTHTWVAAGFFFWLLTSGFAFTGLIALWGLALVAVMFISLVLANTTGNVNQLHGASYFCRLVWAAMALYALWMAWKMAPIFEEDMLHYLYLLHLIKYRDLPAAPPFDPITFSSEVSAAMIVAKIFYFGLVTIIAAFFVLVIWSGIMRVRSDRLEGIRLLPCADFFDGLCNDDEKENLTTSLSNTEKPKGLGPVKSHKNFSNIIGYDDIKAKLLKIAHEWKTSGKNGILLYGEPGTGKSHLAEALAGELKLPLVELQIGKIASKWVNDTTEKVMQSFDEALRCAPCVLFIDEVETVFPTREMMGRSDGEEQKVVGAFLASTEKLRRGRVLIVAATNYRERTDPAAIREGRFDFHIEVPLPDAKARQFFIEQELKKTGKTAAPGVLDKLVVRWAGFNVKRLQLATERAAVISTASELGYTDFKRGLRDMQGGLQGLPEKVPDLQDLYFDASLKHELNLLADQFRKIDEIEALGGSVPKGIIFYGPPGTGKTTMAQSLAKAAEFTFIATSGKELIGNGDALKKLRQKASDFRPAMVFIDEADDILGDRQISGHKMHTNELLQTIDGAGKPLPDVVWVLATNHIDGFDEAVYRRFPKKLELPIPGSEVILAMVRDWGHQQASHLLSQPVEAWLKQVTPLLQGLAPSSLKEILQNAKNYAIAVKVSTGAECKITPEIIIKSRKEMML